MKGLNIAVWILLAIPLFPIMLLATSVYPAWEKWGSIDSFFMTVVWIILAPIMVITAQVAQHVYPTWEAWGAEF